MSEPAYMVGYSRPPVHARSQKGRPGHPGGKPGPKKLTRQAFDTAVTEAMNGDRHALKDSKPAKVMEAFARRLALDAVDGKPSAQRLLLSILDRDERGVEAGPGQSAELSESRGLNSLTQGISEGIPKK